MVKLNLGCGDQCPDGWVNVDYSLGAKLAKLPVFSQLNKIFHIFNMEWDKKILIHDLRKKFPWDDSSVDVIYSSHALEHFSKEDGRRFLGECYRVLKPGGVLRIIVPDLNALIVDYNKGALMADDFVEAMGVGYEMPGDGRLKRLLGPFIRFPHKCMYDTSRLVAIFIECGFKAESMDRFQSIILDVNTVEDESRTERAVIVEGVKC